MDKEANEEIYILVVLLVQRAKVLSDYSARENSDGTLKRSKCEDAAGHSEIRVCVFHKSKWSLPNKAVKQTGAHESDRTNRKWVQKK